MKDTAILTKNGVDLKKSLELFGDMATYDQMLEDFLKEVDNKLDEAKKYKDDGDMANYAIMVHSLKSDCKYFGLFDLADKFYEHELAGKSNDYLFVNSNFDELVHETTKMVNILKLYMGFDMDNNAIPDDSNGEKIIIVADDSTIIRNFIERIFKDKYAIKVANDGEEALSIVSNNAPENIECMFLDLNMPNVDGFQVLDYFKSHNLFKKIPVSIITGMSDKNTIDKAFTYPIVDMISKPFNESAIRNVAMKTIAQKQ